MVQNILKPWCTWVVVEEWWYQLGIQRAVKWAAKRVFLMNSCDFVANKF
jgi:hypothetical protein